MTLFLFTFSLQCQDYQYGKVHGELCKPLCDKKSIHILSCQTRHRGKETVFTADWNNTIVVIKSHKSNEEYIPLPWTSDEGEIYPTPEELLHMISQSLIANYGINEETAIPKLFPFITDFSYLNTDLMINMWQLSQDNEYVLLMLYGHAIFPNVLASCGTFYAVQYAQPISEMDVFTDQFSKWKKRMHLSKLILDLIKILSTSFQDPIHICDVKLEHFGLIDGRIVILDADTIFPKSIVDRSTADGKACSTHEDCDMFDCHSLCNKVVNRCDTPVVNNNLQRICQKIFLDSGLLVSNHLPADKLHILQQCADPYSLKGRHAADSHFQDEFVSFIDEYLKRFD